MLILSPDELANLRAAAGLLRNSRFTGVLVGHGSLILHFTGRSSVLLQGPFETLHDNQTQKGHASVASSAVYLFAFLNMEVVDVIVTDTAMIQIIFGAGESITISPENGGFESYVLRTTKGSFPVS